MATLKQGTLEYWINICQFAHKTRFDECPFCELTALRSRIAEFEAELEHQKELYSAHIGDEHSDCGVAINKRLEAENKRLINIAGDALGFSEYQRDQDTVEVLAHHAKRLGEELAAVRGELAECKAAKERTVDQVYALYDTLDIIKDENNALRARCERLEKIVKQGIKMQEHNYGYATNLHLGMIDWAYIAKQALEVPK